MSHGGGKPSPASRDVADLIKKRVDVFAEELKSAREYNDAINRLLQVGMGKTDDDEVEENERGGGGSSQKKSKGKSITKKSAGPCGEDAAKTKRKGGTRKGKVAPPISQGATGSDSGAAGVGTTPFALRSAIATPSRYRSSAPESSSSDDENRELNTPLGSYNEDSPRFIREGLAQASTVAFVHEEKSAALEGEIRRLQRDVMHHRASEANLRAVLDATTEAWKRESSIAGAGGDNIHERLAASFDAQAHLQETLSREVKSSQVAEEDSIAARKECAFMRDELERIKQDMNEGLLAASKERDDFMVTLHLESTARKTAEEACREAQLQLASKEAQLVKQSEEMMTLSARAQNNSDNLRNELKSARLEATQARARVEETLSALAGAKEAELEARKSETNAVGYSSHLSAQLQALRDELDLTSEQRETFSAMIINANLRHANEELQRTTKERSHQNNLIVKAEAECVEAKAECSSLHQKLIEMETKARIEVDELRSAVQRSDRRADDAEKMLHTLSRAAMDSAPQSTGDDGVGGSAMPNRAREALELLRSMSTSAVEIAALDTAAAEVKMLQGIVAEESRKRQEGEAEAIFLADRLRELTGDEPSRYVSRTSLEAQISEVNSVRIRLEEQLANAEREISDLHSQVEELDRELASNVPAPDDQLHPSAALAEAMQARDMADAQASMLRSCLEDTEEMLEESRSALRDMEQNMKSLKAAQHQKDSKGAPTDETLKKLRLQADEAQRNATSAIIRAEEAESKLSATEARLEEVEEVRSKMLIEHQEAISAFEASLKEAEEAGNAMVAEHQLDKFAHDVKLKEMEIKFDATLTEHQDAISAYEANLKEEEAARRVAISEVERLQTAAHEHDANLESLREALHEATEKNSVSCNILQHAERANRELEELVAQSRGEMNSLRDELHQAKKDRFTIEETLNGSMHDIGEILAQKEDAMNQLDDLQDRLSVAKAKLADVESANIVAVADAENARVAAKEALEQVKNADARLEDAEARAEDAEARAEDAVELLREDLAVATANLQAAKEEVKSMHLRLAHSESQLKADEEVAELRGHETWLTSGVEPTKEFSSVAVQASNLESSLPTERAAHASFNVVRTLETDLKAEKDLNSRLQLDLDAAEIKARQSDAENGELQATSAIQARRIDVLTAQLASLQLQVSVEVGEGHADMHKFGERLAEALSDDNNLRSSLTNEGEARRVADEELARVRAQLSAAENVRIEAEAKEQATDAMNASLISPEPVDQKLQEIVYSLQEEIAQLQSEKKLVVSHESQHVAEMEKIISQRDEEASKRAAAEMAITKLEAQLNIALEDDTKATMLRDHADMRAKLMAALEVNSNQLAEENSRTETAEAKLLAAEEENERLVESLQTATAALDNEISLQEKVHQLKVVLKTEKSKRNELATQLEVADFTSARKLMEVEKLLANTRSELLEARQMSHISVAELEATNSLMEEAQAASQRSAEELKATKKKLTDAQQAAQRSAAEAKAIKKQLNDAREAAKHSADEVKATKKELADLHRTVQRSADEVKATKKKLDDSLKIKNKNLASWTLPKYNALQAARESSAELQSTEKQLEAAHQKAQHYAADLEAATIRLKHLKSDADAAARSASEIEINCADAEQRAMEAETTLASFREDANAALDMKTEEVIAATKAAVEANDAKKAAEAEIDRLKEELADQVGKMSPDKALKTEVVELRTALSEALETQRNHQSAESELKMKLNAAKNASAEREAEFTAKRDQLASKLQKTEESLKALRTESSKTEWTVSVLKSRLQMEESSIQAKQGEINRLTATLSEMKSETAAEMTRLTSEARGQQSSSEAKLLESEQALFNIRRELDDARHAAQRYSGDLEAAKQRFIHLEADSASAARSASDVESRYMEAERRAIEAEGALAAFKDEANITLELKTQEVVSASHAAMEAEAAKIAAEAEIERLKQIVHRMEETSSLDEALKAEVVELRAALTETAEAHRSQQSAQSELKIRLEAAEAASAEREAEFAARRDQLASKLQRTEESLKALRAESSKTEWTVSELKSRLQMEESRMQAKLSEIDRLKASLSNARSDFSAEKSKFVDEASAQRHALEAKLLELEQSLSITRRDLDNAQQAAQRYAADLEATKQRFINLKLDSEAAIRTSNDFDSMRSASEDRAVEAEIVLAAFKDEAKITLEMKTAEVVAATQAAAEAEDAKNATEAEIERLKQALASYEQSASLDEALKAEVAELRAALTEAAEAHRSQQSAQSELKIRLEAAEAASAEREAEFAARRDQLALKLEIAEQHAKESLAESSKTEWSISVLNSRVQMEELRVQAKQSEIDRLTSALSEMKLEVSVAKQQADALLANSAVKVLETEEALAATRRELESAHQAAEQHAVDMEADKRKHRKTLEDAARSASEIESKYFEAEERAMEAEAALEAFQGEASMTLELKTEEFVSASHATIEAEAAKNAAEGEVERLKQALASYEQSASLDEALKAEVVELRAALTEATDVQIRQQSAQSELKIRLEAAEAASGEQEAEFAARRDQLASKLQRTEESLKALRAESSKTEWTVSELKSRIQVEEMKVKDATTQQSASAAKLQETEQAFSATRRELEEIQSEFSVTKSKLMTVMYKYEQAAQAGGEFEAKCAASEHRAAVAEAALAAFKHEAMVNLEMKTEEVAFAAQSEAERAFAAFKMTANTALEKKTGEVLSATSAAAEASAAKNAAEAEIENMKRVLQIMEDKSSLDEALKGEALELRAALTESTRSLQKSLLDAAEAASKARAAETKNASEKAAIETVERNAAKAEVTQLRARLEEISKAEAASRKAGVETAAARDAAEAEVTQLRARLEEISKAQEASRKAGVETAAARDAAEAEVTQLRARLEEISKAQEATRKAGVETAAARDAAEAEVTRLRTRLEEISKAEEASRKAGVETAAVRDAAEAEVTQLRARLEEVSKAEEASRKAGVETAAVRDAAEAEVTRLTELLRSKSASETEEELLLHEEVLNLRAELAQALGAHTSQSALHDELRSQLDSLQHMYENCERDAFDRVAAADARTRSLQEEIEKETSENQAASLDTKQEILRLNKELEVKDLHLTEARLQLNESEQKAATANAALESTKSEMNFSLAEQTMKASEAAGRAAEATASKAAVDAELARLDALCVKLKQGDDAALADAVEAESKQLTATLRELQQDHSETLGVCETLREQLEKVAAAAERSKELNERRIEETEATALTAEAQLHQTRQEVMELAIEASAARAGVASLSAVRASLEDELAAREAAIKAALNARKDSLDEANMLRRKLSSIEMELVETKRSFAEVQSNASKVEMQLLMDIKSKESVYQHELAQKQRAIEEIGMKAGHAEEARKSAAASLQDAEQQLSDMKAQAIEAEAEREVVLTEKSRLSAELARAEKGMEIVRSLRAELLSVKSEALKLKQELSSSGSSLQTTEAELHSIMKASEEREHGLQSRAENAEQRERELHAKIISAQGPFRELQSVNSALEAKLASSVLQLSTLQEESIRLASELKVAKHSKAEESERLMNELKIAKVEAADIAEKYHTAEIAVETKMMSREKELERMRQQVETLEEALSAAQGKIQDENVARKDAELKIISLERRLVADSGEASLTTAAVIDAMNGLNEESERLLAESQQEVEDSHSECDRARKQLKAAESRIGQLQNEVLRLQKHEHALHALIGAAE